jgi:hypothetical protein
MEPWRPQPHLIAKTWFAGASASNTFTVVYVLYSNAECLISIVAGSNRRVRPIGFGLDSIIEVFSGAALLWRLGHDLDRSRRKQVERITLRIAGWCFVAPALFDSRSRVGSISAGRFREPVPLASAPKRRTSSRQQQSC